MNLAIYVIRKIFLGRKVDFLILILLFGSILTYPLYKYEKMANEPSMRLYNPSGLIDGKSLVEIQGISEVILVACFNFSSTQMNKTKILLVKTNDLSKPIYNRFLIKGRTPKNSNEALSIEGWNLTIGDTIKNNNTTYIIVGLINKKIMEKILGFEADYPTIFTFENNFFNSQQALIWTDPLAPLETLKNKIRTQLNQNTTIVITKMKLEQLYLTLDILITIIASTLITYLYLHFSRLENAIFYVTGWKPRHILVTNIINLLLILSFGLLISFSTIITLSNLLLRLNFMLASSLLYFLLTIPTALITLHPLSKFIFTKKIQKVLFE